MAQPVPASPVDSAHMAGFDNEAPPNGVNIAITVCAAFACLCCTIACIRLKQLCTLYRRREFERQQEQRFALAAAMSDETCEARL
jgi:hypothetical protein